ncbi:MAG: hypothetical protein AAGI68_01745 [Planctomycetota bacterium]
MSDTSIAGTPAGEARRLAMLGTAGSGGVTLVYWGLWEWTGLVIMGAVMAIGVAATAGLAAAWSELAFGTSDDEHDRPSRMAILASSLGTWTVILGALLAFVRVVRGLFSDPAVSTSDWPFWLSVIPVVGGLVVAGLVFKDKSYFASTRVKGVTTFPIVLALSGVAGLVLYGMANFGGRAWIDGVGGLLLAWGGLGILWAGLWRQFNRFTGLDIARPDSSAPPLAEPPPSSDPAPALDPTDLKPPPPADPPPAYPSDTEDLSPIELAEGPTDPPEDLHPDDPNKPTGQA